ncbi:ComEA family DNA-binding protein [Methylobacterium brachythecii]|nr:helix-hairpin-helix domain-containing protein [Methylobacterium brachythecii]MBB3904651.1 outer membrane biosynthesis protein TonB [Methylobacterium brachythecii]
MLNGPALLRVFLVVIAAAVLTALVQHYWIFDSSAPEPSKPVLRPTAQNTPAIRQPEPPRVAAAPAPASQPAPTPQPAQPSTSQPKEAPKPPPQAQIPAPATTPENSSAEPPSPPPVAADPVVTQPAPAARSTPPSPAAPMAEQAEPPPDDPVEPADARAVDLVDLNTGSLTELNALKGGGTIGRAIIQHRPYTSTDQLLSKRVLSRTTYQRIKGQITVR